MVRRSQGRRTVYLSTPAFNPRISGPQAFVSGASSVISRRKSAGTNGFSRLGATHIDRQEIDRIERERRDAHAANPLGSARRPQGSNYYHEVIQRPAAVLLRGKFLL
jgi:hypothetical protein